MQITEGSPLKLVLYILGKVAAALVAVGLIVLGFFTAMNTMNVMVMSKDAFTKRTSVILKPIDNKDRELLDGIYTEEYLNASGLYTEDTNSAYMVNSYAQRTDVKFVLVMPWTKEVKVEVTDVIENISATFIGDADTSKQVTSFIDSGVYEIRLIKTAEGNWKVNELELVEEITPESVYPIPTPAPAAEEEEVQ